MLPDNLFDGAHQAGHARAGRKRHAIVRGKPDLDLEPFFGARRQHGDRPRLVDRIRLSDGAVSPTNAAMVSSGRTVADRAIRWNS